MDLELNLGEARWLIDEALSMARLTGDERLLGVVLGNLCEVRRYEGHYRRAIRSAREALAIMEATGDAPRAAWQLVTIAHCQFLQRAQSCPSIDAAGIRVPRRGDLRRPRHSLVL